MLNAQQLLQQAQALYPYIRALRREIHQHPELGRREKNTQALILRELSAMGIEAEPCADTGVLGIIRGEMPGKTIGLRADIDALPIQEETNLPFASQNPGVMHACGHDTHAASLLGAARILQENRALLRGNVKLFFQPDEEDGGGAQRMVDEGCLQDPPVSAVFCGHSATDCAAGQYGLKYDRCYAASNPFTITVHGKGCHGAFPADGIDAVLIGSAIVNALQTLVSRRIFATDSAVVTVGSFHSGTAGNIIAETAQLKGIIRTLGPEMRRKMCALFRETVEGVARTMGGSVDIDIVDGYPGVTNTNNMTDLVRRAMIDLVGEENILLHTVPEMGSEDFGAFMDNIPGCYAFFGFGDGRKECVHAAHSSRFVVNEEGLVYAAALHAKVALDYLNQDEF